MVALVPAGRQAGDDHVSFAGVHTCSQGFAPLRFHDPTGSPHGPPHQGRRSAMSRGARAVARLLAGVPATSVNLDDLDADWRPLAEVLLDAPDRGAALEAALAQRPDGQQRWAELLAADALEGEAPEHPRRFQLV